MAKKVIANLNIQLSASSATLKTDFDLASSAVKKLGGDVEKTSGLFGKLANVKNMVSSAGSRLVAMATSAAASLAAITIAATLATAGLSGVMDRFAAIDEAGETAARLGTTADALLALRHAAQMTGTDVESVDKGLGILLRKLDDASKGGASAGVFERLGLSVAELQRMAPQDMLAAVADKIAALPSASERAGAAFALFGKQGEGLVNLLAAGGDSIREYAAEADKLGLTIGAIDAGKIAAANDEWDRAKAAFVGLANQLAVAVAPAAERVAVTLTRFGVSLAKTIETNRPAIEAFASALADTFGALIDWVSGVLDVWNDWLGTMEETRRRLAAIGDAVGKILSLDIGGLWEGDFGGDWAEREAAAKAEAAAMEARAKAQAEAAEAFAKTAEAAETAATAVTDAEAATAKWADVGKRLTDELATPWEKFEERAAELYDAFNHGAISGDVLRRGVDEATKALEAAELSADRIGKAVSTPSIGAAVRGTAAGFAAVQGGQEAMRDLREAARRSAESDARREKLQQAMAEALGRIAAASGEPKVTVKKVSI